MLKRSVVMAAVFCGMCIFLGNNLTHAISPTIVLATVQLGGSGTGTTNQELISIYNNSNATADITNWCLQYSSLNNGTTFSNIACFVPPDTQTQLWLPASGTGVVASNEFMAALPQPSNYVIDAGFAGGMVSGESGHIRVTDASGVEIDRLGYGAAVHPEGAAATKPVSGKVLQRAGSPILQDTDNNFMDFSQATLASLPISNVYEESVPVDMCPNIVGLQTTLPDGYLHDAGGDCHIDACQNLPGLQTAVPDGYESSADLYCTLIPLEDAPILITELLPNVAGVDSGNEFVELYNPNSRAVNLKGYKLELGPAFTKNYVLFDEVLSSGEYVNFSDAMTGIILPNTSASLRLMAPAGNIVGISEAYDSPAENMAWALVGGTWQYTNQPTPGVTNQPSSEEEPDDDGAAVLAACPAGKYRNPETNRCRNIDSGETNLAPCAAGQIRNPDTNRCRSVFSSGSSLAPCQPGQTRNPDTNRCRSAAATASAKLKPCAANQERNPQTNRCRQKTSSIAASSVKDIETGQSNAPSSWMITGSIVLAAAAYGAWEWRSEVMSGLRRLRQLFAKSPLED